MATKTKKPDTCGICRFGHKTPEAFICYARVHAVVVDNQPRTMRIGVNETDPACADFQARR